MRKTTYAIGFRKVEDKCIHELVEITQNNNVCSLCSRYTTLYIYPTKKEAIEIIKRQNKISKENGNLFEGY